MGEMVGRRKGEDRKGKRKATPGRGKRGAHTRCHPVAGGGAVQSAGMFLVTLNNRIDHY